MTTVISVPGKSIWHTKVRSCYYQLTAVASIFMTWEKKLTNCDCYKILNNKYCLKLAAHSPHKIACFTLLQPFFSWDCIIVFFPAVKVLDSYLPSHALGFSDSRVYHARWYLFSGFSSTYIWVQKLAWQSPAFYTVLLTCTYFSRGYARPSYIAIGSKTKPASSAKFTKEHNYMLNMYLVAILQKRWLASTFLNENESK